MIALACADPSVMPVDNLAYRALFSLPPVTGSAVTALAVPALPPKTVITGDEEVDAVLWLRDVIKTGQAPLIEKAMQAAKLITTPLPALEKRYVAFLARTQPGNFSAVMMSIGFANLERLAADSIRDDALRHEALARFGDVDALFAMTPAEQACEMALTGLKEPSGFDGWNERKVDARFAAHPELMPSSLSDCLHELEFWPRLYWLRMSLGDSGDAWPAGSAHDDFAFRCLARIPPRSKDEATAVLDYMLANDEQGLDRVETSAILRNLVESGWV